MTKSSFLLGSAVTASLVMSLLSAHRYYRASLSSKSRGNIAAAPSVTPPVARDVIQFVPEIVEFGEKPVFSGDRLNFEVAVENKSRASILVTEIPRSCGCLTFGKEGDLKLPSTLRPGERMPLLVRLATEGRSGYQTFQVQARAAMTSGEPIAPASLTIRGRIMTSILPLPGDIWLDVHHDERDAPVVRKVVLADEWPGDGLGIGIAKIDSTAGSRMQFDLAKAGGRILIQGLDLTIRRELTITYTVSPGATSFDESITITPSFPSAKPGKIRLHGRVLPDYEFNPDQLFIQDARPGATASRILVYHYHRPVFQDLRPIEVPEGVTVAEAGDATEGIRRFRVTCRLPEHPGKKQQKVIFQIGHDGKTIPVLISMFVGTE